MLCYVMLYLGLVETKYGGDLDPSGSRQVSVEMKLLLQFRQLFVGKVGSTEIRRQGVSRTEELKAPTLSWTETERTLFHS